MYLRYGVASALERPHNLVGLSAERVGELARELVVTATVRCSVLWVHGSYLTGDTSKIKELVVTCLNFLISSK